MHRLYETRDPKTGKSSYRPWAPTGCTEGHPIKRLGHAACPDCGLGRNTWHCGDQAHTVWDPDHVHGELSGPEREVHYLDGRVEIVTPGPRRTNE